MPDFAPLLFFSIFYGNEEDEKLPRERRRKKAFWALALRCQSAEKKMPLSFSIYCFWATSTTCATLTPPTAFPVELGR
jgi:hypothetical protein